MSTTIIISDEDLRNWLRELKIVAIEGYDEDGNKYFATLQLRDRK